MPISGVSMPDAESDKQSTRPTGVSWRVHFFALQHFHSFPQHTSTRERRCRLASRKESTTMGWPIPGCPSHELTGTMSHLVSGPSALSSTTTDICTQPRASQVRNGREQQGPVYRKRCTYSQSRIRRRRCEAFCRVTRH